MKLDWVAWTFQRHQDSEPGVGDSEHGRQQHDHHRASHAACDVRAESDAEQQHQRGGTDPTDQVGGQPAEDDRRTADRRHEQLVEVAEIDLGHQR